MLGGPFGLMAGCSALELNGVAGNDLLESVVDTEVKRMS